MKAYGFPYKGSKNRVAKKIIQALPASPVLHDLFCGGLAISHCALLSGKFNEVRASDADPSIKQMYERLMLMKAECTLGQFGRRFVTREEFNTHKHTDPLISLLWSFGNGRRHYIYGRTIEPWKKAVHNARVLGDRSLLQAMGIASDGSRNDIRANNERYARMYADWYNANYGCDISHAQHKSNLSQIQRHQNFQRCVTTMISIEHHVRIMRTKHVIEDFGTDDFSLMTMPYLDAQVPTDKRDGIVYCDIPYKGTRIEQYKAGIDHEQFYEWAQGRSNVYISEYEMPEDRFECVAEFDTRTLAGTVQHKVKERLFIPKTKVTAVRTW